MTRRVVLTLLVTLLLVTNLAAGIARGRMDVADQVVICTGQGPVMIYLDANGQKTAPPRLCPDGVLALFGAATAPVVPIPQPVPQEFTLSPAQERTDRAFSVWIDVKARSPPASA